MSWAKMSDTTWSDPALTNLSSPAWRLYWCCVSYSAMFLTDGLLDDRQIQQVAAVNCLQELPDLLDELLREELLNKAGKRWQIVRYLNENLSRERVEEMRRMTARRVAIHRRKRGAKGDPM